MSALRSPRSRWWLLAAAWVALLVLGIGGFLQQARDLDLDSNTLDSIYFTLQLAALDFEGASEMINWRLQIARFVAPVMTAGTLLQSASVVFREQFSRWRVRFARGHTVVCGLGPAGARLAASLAADGRRVVGIDPDPAAASRAATAHERIDVLAGDPSDAGALAAARVDRARQLIAVSETDAVNVAVTASASGLARSAGAPTLRCAVHLANAELAHLLRAAELGGNEPVRIEFFNLHERAARALVAEHALGGIADGAHPHLVVIGLGQFGRSVVLAAALQWADVGAGPLVVTLVDRAAAGRYQAMRLQHPGLGAGVDARCLDLDLSAPNELAVDEFTALLAQQPPTLVVIAFEDESLALSSALFVRRTVRDDRVEVVVRTESDGGLSAVLGVADADIVTFPFLDRACSVAAIEGGVREQLAHAIHDDHVARSGSGSRLHQSWEQLSDADRESSRHAADGIVEGLRSIGCELVPLRSWGDVTIGLGADEVERLASAEHARWMAERSAAGWTWGPVRDDATLRNPLLVEWNELPDANREHNRAAVVAFPAMLARAGFEIARV